MVAVGIAKVPTGSGAHTMHGSEDQSVLPIIAFIVKATQSLLLRAAAVTTSCLGAHSPEQ